jgi:hypothetical protein
MKLDLIDKVIVSVISLFIITILTFELYLDKIYRASKMLNREVENFSNQNKQRSYDEKERVEDDYQTFQYEPYEKQEGFTPVIEGLDTGKKIVRAFTKPFQPLIDFFKRVKEAFEGIPVRVRFTRNNWL